MNAKHTVVLDALVADMVTELNDDDREIFEERAGIIQHLGKLPQAHAEALALINVLHRNPMALTRVSGIWVEIQGDTGIILTTDLAFARDRLAKLGGRELRPLN